MEITATSPSVLESSRKNRRRGPDKNTWQKSNNSSGGPWRPSRREFLGAAAALLGGAAIFGIHKARSEGDQQSPPQATAKPEGVLPKRVESAYNGWERYENSNLPKEVVMGIARDLASNTEYPGFAEVGSLLIEANTTNGSLAPRIRPLNTQEDLRISLLRSMAQKMGAVAYLEIDNTSIGTEGEFKLKGGGEFRPGLFTRIEDPTKIQAILDSNTAFAPDEAKRLLIVKELSHLLLITEHKRAIMSQVLQDYDIRLKDPTLDLEDILYVSALDKPHFKNIPSLTDLFDNAGLDIDGGGYWYILKALGKMISRGLLKGEDLVVLNSNVQAFEAAKRRGLLIERGKGEFDWKEGIGPFSPEWTAIGRAVLRNEYHKLK